MIPFFTYTEARILATCHPYDVIVLLPGFMSYSIALRLLLIHVAIQLIILHMVYVQHWSYALSAHMCNNNNNGL